MKPIFKGRRGYQAGGTTSLILRHRPSRWIVSSLEASDVFYKRLPSKSVELGATRDGLADLVNRRIQEDYDLVADEIYVARTDKADWDVELFLRSMLYESNRFCEDIGLSQANLPCILIMEDLNCREGG